MFGASHQRESISWFLGVVFTTALILLLAYGLQTQEDRRPASIPRDQGSEVKLSKKDLLAQAENMHLHRHGKSDGIVSVAIRSTQTGRFESGSVIKLEATVTALQDVENLEFSWILPRGIVPSSGEAEGHLKPLASGEELVLELSVISEVVENRQINLHVFRRVGDELQGKMAQFNTVDQELIDQKIKNKAELLHDHKASGSLKIVQ